MSTRKGAVVDERDEYSEIDERSERWATAVHEAGHALVVELLGGRVLSCRVHPRDDARGNTRHSIRNGVAQAVVAVAGERAGRLLLGAGGGSRTDYEIAAVALIGSGHSIADAEHHADLLLRGSRRELRNLARRVYRSSR